MGSLIYDGRVDNFVERLLAHLRAAIGKKFEKRVG